MNFFPLTLLASLIFIVFKFANVGVRLSDTNVYFYTAYELLRGKMLYKDIFFTNMPLFPYLSSLYVYLLNGKLEWYYLTSGVEVVLISFCVYIVVFLKTKNSFLSFTGSILYLFSFIVLSTSDHQTGVFIASLFSILSYIFYLKKKNVMCGIFLGLMIVTKAYYVPIIAAFILDRFFTNKKQMFYIMLGFVVSVGVVLTPTLLFAQKEFFHDVFYYSLFRTQGINKLNIIRFFILHDFLFVVVMILLFFQTAKNRLLSFILMFSVVFIALYKDVYYLYLNLCIPFIVCGIADLYNNHKYVLNKYKVLLFIAIAVFISINMYQYVFSFAEIQKILDIQNVVLQIQKEKPKFIYGVEEITTAFAYLSNTPLLNNIVDTNESLFGKKVLDAEILTKNAIEKKAMVVMKGVNYPTSNINEPILTTIVNKDMIKKNCAFIFEIPVKSEGIINRINIFNCAIFPKKTLD